MLLRKVQLRETYICQTRKRTLMRFLTVLKESYRIFSLFCEIKQNKTGMLSPSLLHTELYNFVVNICLNSHKKTGLLKVWKGLREGGGHTCFLGGPLSSEAKFLGVWFSEFCDILFFEDYFHYLTLAKT